MLKKVHDFFISQINKCPKLKKNLFQVLDCYHQFGPVIFGNLVRNPAYLKHVLNSKVLAKPGLFSFGAIFNPGALLLNDEILLLSNAQKAPWFKAHGKKKELYMQGNPLIIRFDQKTEKVIDQNIITKIINLPQDQNYAIEDFRLFPWKGKKMVNHSMVTRKKIDGLIGQVASVSALSVLDEKEKTFRFCAVPNIDFPFQNFEKNWVYKENGRQLLLFYSLNPYIVLELDDEKTFSFKSIINQQQSSKIIDPGNFGTMVSLSTNPIDFDEIHWLVIIHQIRYKFTGRCYFHWAVLIDKLTFLPVKITSKPIFTGMGARGRSPGIRYISSILKVENKILFFAGEGDVYVTVTKVAIAKIEKLFIEL